MARAALGWTVKTLSERSGVAPSTINRFEAGKKKPLAAIHAAIHRALVETGAVSFSNDDKGWPGTHSAEGQ